jgi:FSR family fosmidomycin resistance protein-like MFS transporter
LYQGSVAALTPYFAAVHHLNYRATAGIILSATLFSSMSQPLFGHLSDRRSLPWLVPLGMGIGAFGVALAGLASSYILVCAAFALSGLGIAAYHPAASRIARVLSDGSQSVMGWFSLAGNLGFFAAPVFIPLVVGGLGLRSTPLLALPAAVMVPVSAKVLRRVVWHGGTTGLASTQRTNQWRSFSKLTVAIVARSVVTFGLSAFLVLYTEQRLSAGPATGELGLLVFFGTGAIGTIWGGRLARRHHRVAVIRVATLAAVPGLLLLVLAPGLLVFVGISVTGLTLYIPFALNLTLGQDYLPTRMGTASGVTVGLAVSVGGLAAPLLGLVADSSSLQIALACLMAMPVVAVIAMIGLREPPSLVAESKIRD